MQTSRMGYDDFILAAGSLLDQISQSSDPKEQNQLALEAQVYATLAVAKTNIAIEFALYEVRDQIGMIEQG